MKRLINNKGITLMALALTIIVLLILSGITIATLTGDNGLIGKTGDAKRETEIAEEKEVIETEYINALGKNKLSNQSGIQESLKQGLDKTIGKDKTEVTFHGEGFDILIVDKNYYYTIDDDGNVTGPEEIIEIEYAGDITKNKKYNGTTEEKAYRIECIEDLVKFSEMTKTNNISDKYVVLTKDLDFKSVYSYNNYKTTQFGNLNGNDQDGNELYTEMTTGTGFNPIRTNFWRSTFDGKGHWIKNLYENYETDNIGLIGGGTVNGLIIKNLNITGKIKGNNLVGGICGYVSAVQIENCNNYATISGNNSVGGICGQIANYSSNIKSCKNYGTITGNENKVGGIAGSGGIMESCENHGKIKGADYIGGITGKDGAIKNSINYEEISGNNYVGGIVGENYYHTRYYIENCCNKGKVTGKVSVGGIEGQCISHSNVINSYNVGDVVGTDKVGGIIGRFTGDWSEPSEPNYCKNCYNIGSVSGTTNIGGAIGSIEGGRYIYYKNIYYKKGIASKGIGNKDDAEGVVESKEDSDLKADAMIALLNENNSGTEAIWFKDTKNINNGYPILSYQNN